MSLEISRMIAQVLAIEYDAVTGKIAENVG